MKKIMLLAAALCCSLSFAQTTVKSKQADYLFSQTAVSANLIPIKSEPGYYRLVMYKVLPNTTWFTDRPERKAGYVSTEQFVADWNKGVNSFAKDSPNAELVTINDDGNLRVQKNAVLELMHPSYQPKTGILIYRAKAIQIDDVKPLTNDDLHQVALFIDTWIGGVNVNL